MTAAMKHCHVQRRPGLYIQHTSFLQYGLTRVADSFIKLFIFSFVIVLVAVQTSWWYNLKFCFLTKFFLMPSFNSNKPCFVKFSSEMNLCFELSTFDFLATCQFDTLKLSIFHTCFCSQLPAS